MDESLSRKILGERIKALRSMMGFSGGEMAEKLKISVSKLSKVENGHQSLSNESLLVLLNEFRVDANWLFSHEDASVVPVFVEKSISIREYERLKEEKYKMAEELAEAYRKLYRQTSAELEATKNIEALSDKQ